MFATRRAWRMCSKARSEEKTGFTLRGLVISASLKTFKRSPVSLLFPLIILVFALFSSLVPSSSSCRFALETPSLLITCTFYFSTYFFYSQLLFIPARYIGNKNTPDAPNSDAVSLTNCCIVSAAAVIA